MRFLIDQALAVATKIRSLRSNALASLYICILMFTLPPAVEGSQICVQVLSGTKKWSVLANEDFPEYIQKATIRFAAAKNKELSKILNQAIAERSMSFAGAIFSDPSGGQQKKLLFKQLGFNLDHHWWNPKNSAPDWLTFAKNYRQILNERQIPIDKVLRPAIPLARQIDGSTEYMMVDPLADKIPHEIEGWRVVDAAKMFNLPADVIYKGISEGKWPLMDAIHDTSHFVAFLRYPEIVDVVMRSVRKKVQGLETKNLNQRLFWVLEGLSFPDRAKTGLLNQFIKTQKYFTHGDSLATLTERLEKLGDAELAASADLLSKVMEFSLADFSGGQSNSSEKHATQHHIFHQRLTMSVFNEVPFNGLIRILAMFTGQIPDQGSISRYSFLTFSNALKGSAKYLTSKDSDLAALIGDFQTSESQLSTKIGWTGTPEGLVTKARSHLRDHMIRLIASGTVALDATRDLPLADWAEQLLLAPNPRATKVGELFSLLFPSQYFAETFLDP